MLLVLHIDNSIVLMLWYDLIIMLLFLTTVETASINHSKSVILLSLYTYSSVAKNLYDWVDCLTCVSNGDCLRSYYEDLVHIKNVVLGGCLVNERSPPKT